MPIPAPGEIVAQKYQVERVLGAGGMGVVLAARHLVLGQRVAIKCMQAEGVNDPNAVSRFLREARAAGALSNEHVTRVLDVGQLEAGEPYMVMEYLEGVDFEQFLQQRGPLPAVDAVGAVLQACEGIAEAHAMGIVHRDLKPANLFLSKQRDGSTLVKVLDFGISKATDFGSGVQGASLTSTGLVMGSPAYMSPEHVRDARGVDARTDIWALGVILYELLTGTKPFMGDSMGAVLALILSETAPSVRKSRRDLPEGLAKVIARCLERQLDRRIQNVGELAAALLPFGPPDADRSVAQILRWRAETSKPGSMVGSTRTALAEGFPSETGPAWLRSGRSSMPALPRRSGPLAAAIAAGGCIALILVAGVYKITRPAAAITNPAGAVNAASVQPPQEASPSAPVATGPLVALPPIASGPLLPAPVLAATPCAETDADVPCPQENQPSTLPLNKRRTVGSPPATHGAVAPRPPPSAGTNKPKERETDIY